MKILILFLVLFGCKEDKGGEIVTLLPERPKPEISLEEAKEVVLSNLEELKDYKITFKENKGPWSDNLTYHLFVYTKALLLGIKHIPPELRIVLGDIPFVRITDYFPVYRSTARGINRNNEIYIRNYLHSPKTIIKVFYHELCHSYDGYDDIRARYRRIQHYDRYPKFLDVEHRNLREKFAYSCDKYLMGNFVDKHEVIEDLFKDIFNSYDSSYLLKDLKDFKDRYPNILQMISSKVSLRQL